MAQLLCQACVNFLYFFFGSWKCLLVVQGKCVCRSFKPPETAEEKAAKADRAAKRKKDKKEKKDGKDVKEESDSEEEKSFDCNLYRYI